MERMWSLWFVFGLTVWYATAQRIPYARGFCTPVLTHAECVLVPHMNSPQRLQGTVTFEQFMDHYCRLHPLRVWVDVCGFDTFDPHIYHGIHVHAKGGLVSVGQRYNCTSATGHYNPFGTNHGSPRDSIRNRHVGDFGNIRERHYRDYGCIRTGFTDSIASIFSQTSQRNIVGRAIVIHEKRDDLGRGNNAGSLATGNAGSRLACCTIQPT